VSMRALVADDRDAVCKGVSGALLIAYLQSAAFASDEEKDGRAVLAARVREAQA